MSAKERPIESPAEIKKDLLGLEEGWKNWLRPPEPIPLTPKPEGTVLDLPGPKDDCESNIIELKASDIVELKPSVKTELEENGGNTEEKKKDDFTKKDKNKTEDKNEKNKKRKETEADKRRKSKRKTKTDEEDDDEDEDDIFDEDYEALLSDAKEEDSDSEADFKRSDTDSRRKSREEIPYEDIFVKNYNTVSEKQEPLEEFNTIFKETNLQYEKQVFHQKTINKIIKNLDNIKELQTQYLEFVRKAAELEIFACSVGECTYQTIHKENLKTHLLLIHKKDTEEKKYRCKFESCKFNAKSLGGLRNHQLVHIEPESEVDDFGNDNDMDSDSEPLAKKKYRKRSDGDDKSRKKKKYYSNNKPRRRTDDEKARYECDICDINIVGRDAFIKHNRTHKDPDKPKKYICHMCNYGATKVHLKKHLLKVHGVETKGVHEMKKHKCPHCPYITDVKSCLNSHLIVHKSADEVEWLKCPSCDFTTKHKVSLNNHMKFHLPNQEDRKKFMCDVCSKSFVKKQNLEGHMLIHKSIEEVTEIYKCPEADCTYQTKFKCHLITHKQKHQEAKYICDVCGFRTRRQGSYRMHCRLHKDESEIEMFQCSLCPYRTRFKHDLRKHNNSSIHSILAKRAAQAALLGPDAPKKKKRNRKKKKPVEGEPGKTDQAPIRARAQQPQTQPPPLPQPPQPEDPVSRERLIDEGLPQPTPSNAQRLLGDGPSTLQRQIDDGVASRLFYQFSLLNQMH